MDFEAYSERLATLHDFFSLKKIKRIMQKRFQIINESMKMKSVNEIQFAGLNDKRYYFHDGIVSLPFGHFLFEKVRSIFPQPPMLYEKNNSVIITFATLKNARELIINGNWK